MDFSTLLPYLPHLMMFAVTFVVIKAWFGINDKLDKIIELQNSNDTISKN